MKRLISNHRLLPLATFLFAGALVFSVPAHAEWLMIHGHSGHVEDTSKLILDCHTRTGLRIVQGTYGFNFVHFAVPTQGDANKGARYIRIKFKTFSTDAWVSDIDVWNGNTVVAQFPGHWTGAQTLTLDMGSVKSFNLGLGISVKINMGGTPSPNLMDHWIGFYSAGANFVNKP